ncbi:MAG TPA: hypothetical protein V6D25_20580 [Leptolyngbyaceae cyanobacterium]
MGRYSGISTCYIQVMWKGRSLPYHESGNMEAIAYGGRSAPSRSQK